MKTGKTHLHKKSEGRKEVKHKNNTENTNTLTSMEPLEDGQRLKKHKRFNSHWDSEIYFKVSDQNSVETFCEDSNHGKLHW